MKIKFKDKKINVNVKKCKGINMGIGLMFKNKNTDSLLFEFKNKHNHGIHSFFCPAFLALWLDENDNILEFNLVKPNKLLVKPENKISKLIEIPLNKNNEKLINLFLEEKRNI